MAGIFEFAVIVAGALGALWGLSTRRWVIFFLGLGLAVFGFFLVA
ncbi:MAG: hypothetical protein U1B79_01855 [Candidatus Pacearchaeota archaeon]|nr:hypothetical protein [Nanoarchaeota archaeon]MDZ4226830.1 hypothetical protein [Candidatus Pacearchaeota archaeon]